MKPNNNKIALVFFGGKLNQPRDIDKYLRDKPLLIAADSGADIIRSLGQKPDAVIGDFDSTMKIPAPIKNLPLRINGAKKTVGGITYIKYPPDKNFTDSELALDYAVSLGYVEIYIFAMFGDRLDHMLGNIFLLNKTKYKKTNIKIINSGQEIYLINKKSTITGRPGEIISLIPIFGEVIVNSSSGLKYDSSKYRMSMLKNKGISNQLTKKTAQVDIRSGTFLVIHHKSTV